MATRGGVTQTPSDETLARERRVLELRRAGMPFDEIAQVVGYATRAPAHTAYKRALARKVEPVASEVRELEADRLDRLQMTWWPKAIAGDPIGLNAVLRIMERRAKLLGLDHADGIAERAQLLDERMGQLLVGGVIAALAELGLDQDARARSVFAEMFAKLHVERELDDVVDAELVPELPPGKARKPARKPAAPSQPVTRSRSRNANPPPATPPTRRTRKAP